MNQIDFRTNEYDWNSWYQSRICTIEIQRIEMIKLDTYWYKLIIVIELINNMILAMQYRMQFIVFIMELI